MASGIKSVVVTIDGVEYTLTQNSTDKTKWSASAAAPTKSSGYGNYVYDNKAKGPGTGANASGGYYHATVKVEDYAENVTTIDSSNATFGSTLKLQVKEKTAPTCSITYPTNDAYIDTGTPEITFSATDSGSGVRFVKVLVDCPSDDPEDEYIIEHALDATLVEGSSTSSTKKYKATVSSTHALEDGRHKLMVCAEDYDGNWSNWKTSYFRVDTIAPTLSVSLDSSCKQPTSDYTGDKYLTKASAINVTYTSKDANPYSVTVVNETTGTRSEDAYTSASALGVDKTKTISVSLAYGTNVIKVTAKDGKSRTTVATRTVVLDNIQPKVTAISLTPNPADAGATWTLTVTVEDKDTTS